MITLLTLLIFGGFMLSSFWLGYKAGQRKELYERIRTTEPIDMEEEPEPPKDPESYFDDDDE